MSNLIFQMQKLDFYPHTVTQKIQLLQTHGAYIFLTGDYVYKVKKEVDFGFLDYSTLAKRKHFLERELKLNKEIAPELYLEVIPITQQGDKFILNGEGEAIEYTLKMRQFSQDNLLINLLKSGKLDRDRIIELGKIVAEFHLNSETNDRIASFGTVEKIRESFQGNYQATKKYVGIVQQKEQLEETVAYTDRFFEERESLFKERIKNNKIRSCHGDLHLNNICLWNNKIQLFDRIEFNDRFRFGDVIYDIAFTIMDLEAVHRSDFANIFLNTYIEQTGDWLGLQLLPLYLTRQAYVRAKVNSFLLDSLDISDREKEVAKENAESYYKQAWQYTKRRTGKLILMSGLSGSGKSTVAKIIAIEKKAILIRSDAVRKHIAGIPLNESGRNNIYTSEMTLRTYNTLLKLGITLAKEGFSIILDAKFDRFSLRQQAIDKALSNNILLKIVQCTAPLNILRERIDKRKGDISDATVDLITSQQSQWESYTELEQDYVITIDTSVTDWEETILNKLSTF